MRQAEALATDLATSSGTLLRRWTDAEHELSAKAARARQVREELVADRSLRGTPLTRRGRARLLDELEALHLRLAVLAERGRSASAVLAARGEPA